ncbi:MAG: hypothetical protein IPG91_11195 [Ideonella sp.]|nr:hypothetical protein [Ideonella sp.]
MRKLEAAAEIRASRTLTDLLREVEARRGAYRSMTPEQRAAQEAAHRAAFIASIASPDAPAGSVRAALQEVCRRLGRQYLAEHTTQTDQPFNKEDFQ